MGLGRWAILGTALLASCAKAGDAPALETPQEKVSYGMGVGMARSLRRQGIEVDVELLMRGLKDELAGRKALVSDDELRAALIATRAKIPAPPAKEAAEAKEHGDAFLAENGRQAGVVTLPSGLQYKVLRAAEGRTPTDADRVVCHYRGTLVDGTEFDSSYARGRPATFEMSRVIPGWREALRRMPVGSKWQLFIPSELAYGERGMRSRKKAAARIGPNATLIFEMELLGIQPGHGAPGTRTAASPAPPTHPPDP